MKAASKKWEAEKPESAQEWPIYSLLTRMLIQSFCPLLKSEVLFGEVGRTGKPEKFAYWTEQSLVGDLTGQIAVGGDPATLRQLAIFLGQRDHENQPSLDAALRRVQETLSRGIVRLCDEQEFECKPADEPKFQRDYELKPGPDFSILCRLETKYGTLSFFFRLEPSSKELIKEWEALDTAVEPRKIRVYASQLEAVYSNIKQMEQLERRWTEGPQVRAQMRFEIKKLRRTVYYLKSESLETLFSPARKLAQEISKVQGKQVRLTCHGTKIFLDKGLLNYLYEPMLHLIRNAVDHGIEEPAERERQGKPAEGQIKCIAGFSETGLRLIVSDDGRGLDFAKIRLNAVSKGLFTREEADTKLSEDLSGLIFKAGFSTRERADAISGRGLGLDIVRKGLEELGGELKILSTSNHGTAFELDIPLTEDFTMHKHLSPAATESAHEQEERAMLLDELGGYFERLFRSLGAFQKDRMIASVYEAYRLAHSIKGTTAFLGWNRVAEFCHHFEELLKLIAEQKTPVDDQTLGLASDVADRLKEFAEASRNEASYSLVEIRQLESRLMQAVWAVTHSEDHAHFYFGRYHLNAVKNLFSSTSQGGNFDAKPETDFKKAICQPYGALVQFNGDRRGYAGILMPEETFLKVIKPRVAGTVQPGTVKPRIWSLGEFAGLMGAGLSDLALKAGITLQPSAPLSYFGWGEPLRILGNPSYCYACEIQGAPFFLAGDFRRVQDTMDRNLSHEDLTSHPTQIMEETMRQCEKHFKRWSIPVNFHKISTQSELIGFDGGITVIISCIGGEGAKTQSVLFMSYDGSLAQAVQEAFAGQDAKTAPDDYDMYDCLNETSNIVGGLLVAELEKRRLRFKLTPPTLFVGKAYVANFNRLFVTNKWVGNTPKGKFELQILVTHV